MTNYEKLSTSTDSMADFLAEIMTCYGCPAIKQCNEHGGDNVFCRDMMKEWLEAEDDEC